MFGHLIHPSISTGGFELAEGASIYAAPFNSSSLACRYGGFECRNEFSANGKLHDITEMGFSSSISSRVRHLFQAITVCIIILMVAPFKIASAIVVFVLVYMVHTWEVMRIIDKSHGYKSMYGNVSSMFVSMDRKISTTILRFKDFGYSCMSIVKAHYVAKIAYKIQVFISRCGLPNFLFLHTKSKFYVQDKVNKKDSKKQPRVFHNKSRLLKPLFLVCGTKIHKSDDYAKL